jgi:exonuclease SbcD
MLNESKPLVECLNTHVIANTSDDLARQVIELHRNGETRALVCAVPFVRARDVMQSAAGSSGVEKQKQLSDAIQEHYTALYEKALEIRDEKGLEVPIIATGHLTAVGVTKTDSERDIYIGTLDAFSANGFPPADYIALGHIHRPQIVAKSEHIRYCGSPIPLSFDELNTAKQVVIVHFEKQQCTQVEVKEVPRFQKMATIKGDLTSIKKQLDAINSEGSSGNEGTVWLAIEVEVQDFLSDLQQRVQALTEDLDVEVLQLRRAKGKRTQSLKQEQIETLSELTPFDVFQKRIENEHLEEDNDTERLNRITSQFQQIVERVENGADQE